MGNNQRLNSHILPKTTKINLIKRATVHSVQHTTRLIKLIGLLKYASKCDRFETILDEWARLDNKFYYIDFWSHDEVP